MAARAARASRRGRSGVEQPAHAPHPDMLIREIIKQGATAAAGW
jgi:hypothetical protein